MQVRSADCLPWNLVPVLAFPSLTTFLTKLVRHYLCSQGFGGLSNVPEQTCWWPRVSHYLPPASGICWQILMAVVTELNLSHGKTKQTKIPNQTNKQTRAGARLAKTTEILGFFCCRCCFCFHFFPFNNPTGYIQIKGCCFQTWGRFQGTIFFSKIILI